MQNRLGEILEHQGRSLTWLARRMGTDRTYLSRIINEQVNPGADFRRRCAIAIDLPESLLFFGPDCPIVETDSRAEPVGAVR